MGATYPRTAASPPRTAASPPVNGGNCTIRGATRRRHAEGRLLMLQNPPSSPGCGGVAGVNCVPESPASQSIWAISPTTPRCRRLLPRWSALWAPHTREPRPHCPEPRPHRQQTGGLALHGDPCVTCLPVTSPSNGGNCTIRGATRRRHAEGRLLMLQNPHHYRLFAFKGVGGVGIRRSGGGSVGGSFGG